MVFQRRTGSSSQGKDEKKDWAMTPPLISSTYVLHIQCPFLKNTNDREIEMIATRQDLEAAADAGILRREQIDLLLEFVSARDRAMGRARFSGVHVLYYLGGMLAIGAASLFATLAVEALGMRALFGLSTLYALLSIFVARWFERRALGVPAGIFATLAVALTPLTVFALQHVVGLWDDGSNATHYRDYHVYIDWRWLVMELSTLLAGGLALWRFRYTFLVMPLAVTLWYMGMDIVPALLLSGEEALEYFPDTWELRKTISLAFGVLMLLLAFLVDLRQRRGKDYAFWLYLSGLMTFWGALSSMGSGALSGKLIYLAINFFLVACGAVLGRRTFAVFGGVGIALVLGDLSWNMFKDSFTFVLVLTLLGFALIAVGVWRNKHEQVIAGRLPRMLPRQIGELLDARS